MPTSHTVTNTPAIPASLILRARPGIYSENGGVTFNTPFTNGTIFTNDTTFDIFVQGAVSLPLINDPRAAALAATHALISVERSAQTMLHLPPPPVSIQECAITKEP